MSKKVLLAVWVSVTFVALGFVLFSCAPKTAEETTVVIEELVPQVAPAEKITIEPKKAVIPMPVEGVLVIADFDSGTKPNNVGGDFGAWSRDPNDFTQGCFESFIPTIKRGDQGFSIQLMYDVDSPVAAYNGFWMKLNRIDISKYKKLSFWVKGGDESRGFTKVFKIELKNTAKQIGKYYVTDITGNWTNITIPLEKFSGLSDLTSMDEFVIVFEDRVATKKEGAIYIDDIAFLK